MRNRTVRMLFALIALLGLLWLPSQAALAQAGGAEGGIFEDVAVQPGLQIEVPVEIRNVSDLYAVDIEIRFDPDVLTIEDTNPEMDGVQPALGKFLDAGLTLYNEADNKEGVVRFVMTQVNPSEPKSGSGVVLVLYLRGVQAGESDLEVTVLDLSTRTGEGIPVKSVSGKVTVSEDAVVKESTPIPVQDPTLMVMIPTLIPTAIPTSTPTLSPTDDITTAGGDAAVETEKALDAEGASDAAETNQQGDDQGGFSLLKYWWLVAIVVVIVAGLGIYLWVTRK